MRKIMNQIPLGFLTCLAACASVGVPPARGKTRPPGHSVCQFNNHLDGPANSQPLKEITFAGDAARNSVKSCAAAD